MGRNISIKDRLQYRIDNLFSRGTIALIIALTFLSLLIIFCATLILAVWKIAPEGQAYEGFSETMWQSLMRVFDPGTVGGDTGWLYRLVMLFVTIGGIFIFSTLIGILSSGIESKLEELQKGRSKVIEENHTVILGWSEQIFSILSELIIANSNQKNPCIVILGEHDKVEMEDEIRAKVVDRKNTRIVCRTGNPIEVEDLRIVSLNTAKSIIILSTVNEDPDSNIIKTVLAITNFHERRQQPYHIIAEIRDQHDVEIAKIIGKDEVEWIFTGDIIARIVAQTCRQSGLSVVYMDLLDFVGDEIYFYRDERLTGMSFGETLSCFKENAVMGLAFSDGTTCLNPPMETVIRDGDELIVLSEDDDQISMSDGDAAPIDEKVINSGETRLPAPENTLILGWNWKAPSIIQQLDHYVAPDSRILVVADVEDLARQIRWDCPDLMNVHVSSVTGDITERRLLNSLDLQEFGHIIVLSSNDGSIQESDSRTLITLLHLRDLADRNHLSFSIVTEMLDVRNRNLAKVTRADDFIVSDRLVSLMMAQVSENKKLNDVFTDIFNAEGCEIYLKPIEQYIKTGYPVNFYTVIEAARRNGEAAIGYRKICYSQDAERSFGVVLNPDKSLQETYEDGDLLVVIAEE